jgi:hypothetical protein
MIGLEHKERTVHIQRDRSVGIIYVAIGARFVAEARLSAERVRQPSARGAHPAIHGSGPGNPSWTRRNHPTVCAASEGAHQQTHCDDAIAF